MHRSRPIFFLCLIIVFLAACDAIPNDSTIVVKADEIAVVYAQETGALEDTLYEGAYDIQPQQSVAFYPLFWQVYTFRDEFTLSDRALGDEAIEAYTIDEAKMRVNLTLVFRLNADEIDMIFDSWGSADYRVGYIRPTVQRVVRDVIGLYTAENLSLLTSTALHTQIETALRRELEANGFLLQRVDLGEVVYLGDSLMAEEP